MGEYASLLPLAAIALLFWLMVVRPASRRQRAIAKLQADLQPGQQVMLASGMYGTVRSLTQDRARVEIAPGAEVEVARAAIAALDEPAASTIESDSESDSDSDREQG